MKKRQEEGGETKPGMLQTLRVDRCYRRKFVLTLSVFWSYVILGWSVLQIGTALPDLQRLVDVDLETAAWIFTVWSIGFVVGSLVSGRLYDRYNRLVIMLVNSLAMSVCCFSIPYNTRIVVLLIIRFFSGVFAGGIDTGANTIVPTIWNSKDGESFMQAMYLAYTLGGIFAPLATKPFMAQRYDADLGINNPSVSHHTRNAHSTNTSDVLVNVASGNRMEMNNDTKTTDLSIAVEHSHQKLFNYSFYTHGNNETEGGLTTITGMTEVKKNDAMNSGEFGIHYAFIITGLIVLSSTIPYIVMTFIGNFDERATNDPETENPETENLKGSQATKINPAIAKKGNHLWVILVFVAGVNFVYSAIEDGLGDFLTTYCLFHLHWTKSDSVLLMSMYWVASCSGGFAGIFVIKLLGPAKLLLVAFCVWNVSFLITVFGNITQITTLTWIGFLGAGSAMVLVIPAIISWTNENVCEISGKVSSILMLSSGMGVAANPKFIGYMMETYSYGNFIYVLTCEAIVCTLLFIGAIVSLSHLRHKTDQSGGVHVKV